MSEEESRGTEEFSGGELITDYARRAEIEPVDPAGRTLPANLQETIRVARGYAEAARAPNTLRAYASDVGDFSTYCRVELGGATPLPAVPETVVLYIADMASERDLKASTIQRRLASISAWHKSAGFASPTEERMVRETMKGIRRKKGSRRKQAAPLTVGVLKRVVGVVRDHEPGTGRITPAALRDRALLLLGFAGSFRREELSALLVSDLEFFEGRGLVVLVRRSKTDPAGEGEAVGIPYGNHEETCPVTAVERWVSFSGKGGEEPLFCRIDRHSNLKAGGLSGDGINDLVKRRVAEAGLDPSRYSGHSLRAGLPTSASEAKVGIEAWMPHTRHRSVAVAMRYARRGTLFINNPAAQVGL
ncbi:site-specific integrase [Rubrobacter indicoceani]|uniref:tyrosine-type recombinase/integrase n=1 Tax=Rubrobacter indicoceani TaxID=2051957 RepID=UPI0013C50858|nr:site-specific integrase [Rubrobacter indicoceani]